MKKSKKLLIVIIVLILLAIIAYVFISKTKKQDIGEAEEYSISIYKEKFNINSRLCSDLSQKQVQEIASEIFYANHNIINTFYDVSKLTKKDYQMTVWFAKCKGENKTTCTKEEFEKIIQDTYNVTFTEHESLENTLEYSNGKYKLIDSEMEEYQYPIIETIEKTDSNTYKVKFALTNTHINYIHEIKYTATVKMQDGNLYIQSITEYIV